MARKIIAGANHDEDIFIPNEVISFHDLVDYVKINPVEKISTAIKNGELRPFCLRSHEETYNQTFLHCHEFYFHPEWITEYEQKLDRMLFLQSEASMFFKEGREVELKSRAVHTSSRSAYKSREILAIEKKIVRQSTTYKGNKTISFTEKCADKLLRVELWGLKVAIFHLEKNLNPAPNLNTFNGYSPFVLCSQNTQSSTTAQKKSLSVDTIAQNRAHTGSTTEKSITKTFTNNTKKQCATSTDKTQQKKLAKRKNSATARKKCPYTSITNLNSIRKLKKFIRKNNITDKSDYEEIAFLLSEYGILHLCKIGKALFTNKPSDSAYKQAAYRLKLDFKETRKKFGFTGSLLEKMTSKTENIIFNFR